MQEKIAETLSGEAQYDLRDWWQTVRTSPERRIIAIKLLVRTGLQYVAQTVSLPTKIGTNVLGA